jgi:hypothetical protein
MKLKQAIWLLVGTMLIATGDPLVLNGVDALGWFVLGYTIFKISTSDSYNLHYGK